MTARYSGARRSIEQALESVVASARASTPSPGSPREHGGGAVLGLLHVRLVERIDPEHPPGDRGRELGHEEEPPEVGGPGGGEREHRLPRLRERAALGRGGPVGRSDGQVHAVGPGALDRRGRLTDDRDDPAAVLARALGHELLDPQAEAGQRLVDQDRELVAPPARERAEGQAKVQPEVRGAGELGPARAAARPEPNRAGRRGRRRPAPPARSRTPTARRSGRRSPGHRGRPAGTAARSPARAASCPGR